MVLCVADHVENMGLCLCIFVTFKKEKVLKFLFCFLHFLKTFLNIQKCFKVTLTQVLTSPACLENNIFPVVEGRLLHVFKYKSRHKNLCFLALITIQKLCFSAAIKKRKNVTFIVFCKKFWQKNVFMFKVNSCIVY